MTRAAHESHMPRVHEYGLSGISQMGVATDQQPRTNPDEDALRPDPGRSGTYVDDEDAPEMPEPNEPA